MLTIPEFVTAMRTKAFASAAKMGFFQSGVMRGLDVYALRAFGGERPRTVV